MPELSVFIPTLDGRETLLQQVKDAIASEYPSAELIPIFGPDSWGTKLNLAADVFATGDYWLCCCDDTVPHPGWFEPARAMLDAGSMPAARYYDTEGELENPLYELPGGTEIGWCRAFLLTPEIYGRVGPFIDATWYADWDYSERLVEAGIPIRLCDGFSYTHLDGPRTWHTPEEDARQRGEYEASHRRRGVPV